MIKKGKTILAGFTLIELLVTISIIGILSVGIANIDWNRLSDRQKATIFKNRVVSELEIIRNNALFGKSVTSGQIVPDVWRINISTGGIGVQYREVNSGTYEDLNSINITSPEEISAIYCGDSDTSITSAQTVIIDIEKQDLNITGACDGSNRVSLDLNYKIDFTETIEINSVNGLIGDKN